MLPPSLVLQPSLTPSSPPALPHLLPPSLPLHLRMLMVHILAAAWCGRGSRQLVVRTRVRGPGVLLPRRGLLHLLVHHPHHLQVRARLHRRHAHRCPCRHLVRALLPVCCDSHAQHSLIADVCARLSRVMPLSCRSRRGGSKGQNSEVALKRSFTDAVVQRARAILARCACPCRESIFQGKSTSLSVGCRHHSALRAPWRADARPPASKKSSNKLLTAF